MSGTTVRPITRRMLATAMLAAAWRLEQGGSVGVVESDDVDVDTVESATTTADAGSATTTVDADAESRRRRPVTFHTSSVAFSSCWK